MSTMKLVVNISCGTEKTSQKIANGAIAMCMRPAKSTRPEREMENVEERKERTKQLRGEDPTTARNDMWNSNDDMGGKHTFIGTEMTCGTVTMTWEGNTR